MQQLATTISLEKTGYQPLVSYTTKYRGRRWDANDNKISREGTQVVQEVLMANGFRLYDDGSEDPGYIWITPTHIAYVRSEGPFATPQTQGVIVSQDRHADYRWSRLMEMASNG